MGDVSWNSLWAGSLFFTLDSKGISPPVPGASRGDNFDERSKRRICFVSLDVGSCVICLCARGGGVWSTEVGGGWSDFHVFSEMDPVDTGSTVGAHWGAGDAGGTDYVGQGRCLRRLLVPRRGDCAPATCIMALIFRSFYRGRPPTVRGSPAAGAAVPPR